MKSKYQKACRRLAAILCATYAIGVSVPAAATDLVGPDMAVRYEISAVDSEQGALQLLKRIEGAAARMCARLDHGSLASRRNVENCSQKLTAHAVSKVNHPLLLAAYHSKGRSAPPLARLTK